jgi:asparagine synthase (glutamine-hydrolysing)
MLATGSCKALLRGLPLIQAVMCGIVGFWQGQGDSDDALRTTARSMATAIAYRGPDDFGEWSDERAGIALGNRRLAILDLSPEGHQPMTSTTGRYVITYNGEVYNFRSLMKDLEKCGHSFRGHSDTEVILASVEQWGLEAALEKFIGMFAFALWDRTEHKLHLVRDRLGIKPLFIYQHQGTVLFGSELKTFKAHPAFVPELNRGSLLSFLRYRYVPAPSTVYAHARKLLPGHVMTIPDARAPLPPSKPYWSADDVARAGIDNPLKGTDAELIDEAKALLKDAVKIHMVSDVPLGVFLSGGVDSSTVAALMQAQSDRPVRSFSIGFDSDGYDEAANAAAVAKHLGTDHTELYLTSEDALAIIPMLGEMFDEPFADPSQIPTYLVSQLARRQVTVSLSGDGGDEVFGGYNRYLWVPRIWRQAQRMPSLSYKLLKAGVQTISPQTIDSFYGKLSPHLPQPLRVRLLGDKLQKLALAGGATSPDLFFRSMASAYNAPEELVMDAQNGSDHLLGVLSHMAPTDSVDRMMLGDLLTYLPDDILTKVDRSSMSVSLESRVPLLDHRIVEFAWRLPRAAKIRDGQSKWLLRQVLYQSVPRDLIDRPKSGFDLPIDAWLRGPLRAWAADLLDETRLRREGVLNASAIQRLFREHLSGKRNWRDILWAILMFEVWRERWIG